MPSPKCISTLVSISSRVSPIFWIVFKTFELAVVIFFVSKTVYELNFDNLSFKKTSFGQKPCKNG